MGQITNYHARIVVEETPPHYYRKIQTDKVDESIIDPAFPLTSVRDFTIEKRSICQPTCVGNSPVALTIRTNVGDAVVNDDYVVVAHATETKYVKMSIARDDSSGLLEILAFEKTTGDYGDPPAGKTIELDLKEFSVPALGTVLTEEQSWL